MNNHSYEKLIFDSKTSHSYHKNQRSISNTNTICIILIITIFASQFLIFHIIAIKQKNEIIQQLTYKLESIESKNTIKNLDHSIQGHGHEMELILLQKNTLAAYLNNLNNELNKLKSQNVLFINKIAHTQELKENIMSISTILTFPTALIFEDITNCVIIKDCFRSSRDGLTPSIFHQNCDKVTPTITLVKSKDNGTFGGHVQVTWDMTGLKKDPNAFLFSLKHKRKFPIVPNRSAIRTSPDSLPIFGENDIVVDKEKSYTTHDMQCYGNPKGSYNQNDEFSIEIIDVEVFHVKCNKDN